MAEKSEYEHGYGTLHADNEPLLSSDAPWFQQQQSRRRCQRRRSLMKLTLAVSLSLVVASLLLYRACRVVFNIPNGPTSDYADSSNTLEGHSQTVGVSAPSSSSAWCPQTGPLSPQRRADITKRNFQGMFSPINNTFALEAGRRFSEALQIPSVSFDNMLDQAPDLGDVRYAPYLEFLDLLTRNYPLVHKTLTRTKINTLSLLYTWKGRNPNLKPLMLVAHYDVVPVPDATKDQWIHPPFSGEIDENGYVWGRGSVDTKVTLISYLEAIEALIEAEFVPERTVLLAFGHDEEISGHQGAQLISKYLVEDLNLKDGIELLVDEGTGIAEMYGRKFALISTAERGYMDVRVTVETPGGHSSIPPPHTGIGILAESIYEIEQHVYAPHLPDNLPYLDSLRCAAEHASDQIDPWVKWALDHLDDDHGKTRDELARRLANHTRRERYMMSTSQAVDIISGGVKVNALPERVYAVINQRVAVDMHVKDIEEHLVAVLAPVAAKHSLALTIKDHTGKETKVQDPKEKSGAILIETIRGNLEPSPKSPSSGRVWEVLSGTIKHVAKDLKRTTETDEAVRSSQSDEADEIVVSPMLMGGNTDTRWYWPLTRHIYRFAPVRDNESFGVHTVNERISLRNFVECIAFFHELIRNFDENVL
ncbi:hypothetical protein HK102_012260 [Quaeritorhiza haematococci]|nr:hypothetical protein HK102_012260 [Quaeritorhiza haematococci]